MLKSLSLENFTAFKQASLEFVPGLNVVVGENSTGKTHILKLGYTALYVCARKNKEPKSASPTRAYLQTEIADKLYGVFRPDTLGRLTRRDQRGEYRCEVTCQFSPNRQLDFSLDATSESEVTIGKTLPQAWGDTLPVYLPTRELLTIYPGFVSLYETTHLPFDETWRDTCILLGAPLARGPRETQVRELLGPLEAAIGGKVELDKAGRFYLNVGGIRTEMHLVAEGLRKLAMIARLIATGSLIDKGILFWDEPESNLNPKIIKMIARTILNLCQGGIQVFIASHSLFLLRELDILSQQDEFKEVKRQFIGLHRGEDGVEVLQGGAIEDIGQIDALMEELSQSERYLNAEAN